MTEIETLRLQLLSLVGYIEGLEHGRHEMGCPKAGPVTSGSCTCDAPGEASERARTVRHELEDFVARVRERVPVLAGALEASGLTSVNPFSGSFDPARACSGQDQIALGMEAMKLLSHVALFVLDASDRHAPTCAKELMVGRRPRCTCGWDSAREGALAWKKLMEQSMGATFTTETLDGGAS